MSRSYSFLLPYHECICKFSRNGCSFLSLAGCVITFNCMTLPMKFDKIYNLNYYEAELVYINKIADRIPRVEFVAHFR